MGFHRGVNASRLCLAGAMLLTPSSWTPSRTRRNGASYTFSSSGRLSPSSSQRRCQESKVPRARWRLHPSASATQLLYALSPISRSCLDEGHHSPAKAKGTLLCRNGNAQTPKALDSEGHLCGGSGLAGTAATCVLPCTKRTWTHR